MSRRILRTGTYMLYETTQRYRMLSLDEQDFFVWRGPDKLELSDSGHEAAVILHQGDYFLFTQDDEEDGLQPNIPHLACQEGALYRVYWLPQLLPSEENEWVEIMEFPSKIKMSQPIRGFV